MNWHVGMKTLKNDVALILTVTIVIFIWETSLSQEQQARLYNSWV